MNRLRRSEYHKSMGIIKTSKLIFDYLRYGEDEERPEVNRAIDGVDIDVEPGQFIAILGHNGSGKSTLAKHINALLAPTEGTVWLDQMDTRDEAHIWDIRQEAGMVFQNPDNQIIATVVEEDVGFGPENLGVPTPEIWKRVGESLEAVGMSAYRKRSPNKLSGGQKQRVAIARALIHNRSLLLVDEGTSALDQKNADIVEKSLLANPELTLILVSHHLTPERREQFTKVYALEPVA